MMENIKTTTYKLLKWSEKWTKTDMIYLAKGGFWLIAGKVIIVFSTFLLSVAFANLVSKETYGTYKFVLSLLTILLIPTLTGMGIALRQAVARGFEGSLKKIINIKIKYGLIGSLGSIILAGYYYYSHNLTLAYCFLIVAFFVPIFNTHLISKNILFGRKLFKVSTKYESINYIAYVLLMIITLLITQNLFFVLLAYLTVNTITNYIYHLTIIKKFKPNNLEDASTISYGKHISLINVLAVIANQFDKVLLFHFLGATELAIFAFAIALPEQIKGTFKSIGTLAFPKFAVRQPEEIKMTIKAKMFKLALILLAVSIGYALIAPYIFKIFFPNYIASVIYSQIFCFSLIAIIDNIPYTYLQSKAAKKELYIISTTSSIINISLIAIAIPFYGLWGAIFARIIGKIADVIISNYFFFKKISIKNTSI